MGTQVAFVPGQEEQTIRDMLGSQPVFISITTPAASGEEVKIEHSLGRIPHGYVIVDRPFMMFNHGHDSNDTAWDEHFIYLRFSLASVAIGIAVL